MPIKSKKDYLKALAEIEKFFHAKPNTPQGDRLEILTRLVESYEEKYHKIDFPDPMDAVLKTWLRNKVGIE